MIRKYLLFILTFAGFSFYFSQEYKALDTADYQQRKNFLAEYKAINSNYSKSLKNRIPGTAGREIAKNYEAYQDHFQKEIKNKDFVFNSVFTEKLREYFRKIKNYNSNSSDDIKVLLARDNTPNAMCVQDGIFIVNMGLFNLIDNEDQLIAILAHEWGHKILNHAERRQQKLADVEINSKNEIKEIANTKVNASSKAFDLFKTQIYGSTALRRKNETEADSIGFAIYQKTGLEKAEYINALKKLEDFDSIKAPEIKTETYKAIFTFPTHPFKEKWLRKEDFSGYNYNNYKAKLDEDSLSTHPEIAFRIQHLKDIYKDLKTDKAAKQIVDKDFASLKKTAKYEILPNYFHSEDYGLGIYTCLQYLQKGEDEKFYKEWLGKNFQKIYEARKNYNLNRYLDRVDPKDQDETYQQFLNFMWNLSLEDIKNISEFYSPKSI